MKLLYIPPPLFFNTTPPRAWYRATRPLLTNPYARFSNQELTLKRNPLGDFHNPNDVETDLEPNRTFLQTLCIKGMNQ